jgi:uncharacterized membrane protein
MFNLRSISRFQFIVSLLAVGAIIYLARQITDADVQPLANADTYKARVIEIVEAGEIDLGDGRTQPYQVMRVQVLEGAWTDQVFKIDYGKRQVRAPSAAIQVGEELLVTISEAPGALPQAYFVDFVRTQPLLWLLGLFVLASLLLSGWKGVRSLLAMALSLMVIIAYILPSILRGDNPVLVSIMGAFTILAFTLYLVYGWTLKTHAAVLGILLALTVTGLLAVNFINLARLTGFGSEEAMFLSQTSAIAIDLRGLVLSSILIGTMGVLDDLVITQASAVFELHAANPTLGFTELYHRAMRIGQDHVAATVNTLTLAYVGAALPLLLLISLSGEQWVNFLNREFVTEEVVRTLVGSIGLISAVPLTTALASVIARYHEQLGPLHKYLGPATSNNGHTHQH